MLDYFTKYVEGSSIEWVILDWPYHDTDKTDVSIKYKTPSVSIKFGPVPEGVAREWVKEQGLKFSHAPDTHYREYYKLDK